MTVNRWCYRCKDCLSVAFSEIELEPLSIYSYGTCTTCRGDVELMGRVHGERLAEERLQSVCDNRCTNARGPSCDCRCKGKNHGSHRVVTVLKDVGPIPLVIFMSDAEARRNAEEWREAKKVLEDQIEEIYKRRDGKGWLKGSDYHLACAKEEKLRTAKKNRKHDARMRNVRAGIRLALGGDLE